MQRTQRNRLCCVRCVNVNENRKQRKRLIGCFDDWLFRSTIPIGWRLRALRLNGNRFYAMFFACVILLRLLRFVRTFNSYAIDCVACVAFGWKPGLSHNVPVGTILVRDTFLTDRRYCTVSMQIQFQQVQNCCPRSLQFYCNCLPISMIDQRQLLFWKKLITSDNVLLRALAKFCQGQIYAIGSKYNLSLIHI